MGRFRIVVALWGLVTMLALTPAPAGAGEGTCSPPSDGEAFDAATVVFAGELIDSEGVGGGNGPTVRTFAVELVFKGTATAMQAIAEPDLFPFTWRPGQIYLVFVEAGEDGLAIGPCSGTRLLASADAAPFEGGQPPGEGSSGAEGDAGGTDDGLPLVLILAGGTLVGLAAFVGRRMIRSPPSP